MQHTTALVIAALASSTEAVSLSRPEWEGWNDNGSELSLASDGESSNGNAYAWSWGTGGRWENSGENVDDLVDALALGDAEEEEEDDDWAPPAWTSEWSIPAWAKGKADRSSE